jgi:hypothetical protein
VSRGLGPVDIDLSAEVVVFSGECGDLNEAYVVTYSVPRSETTLPRASQEGRQRHAGHAAEGTLVPPRRKRLDHPTASIASAISSTVFLTAPDPAAMTSGGRPSQVAPTPSTIFPASIPRLRAGESDEIFGGTSTPKPLSPAVRMQRGLISGPLETLYQAAELPVTQIITLLQLTNNDPRGDTQFVRKRPHSSF